MSERVERRQLAKSGSRAVNDVLIREFEGFPLPCKKVYDFAYSGRDLESPYIGIQTLKFSPSDSESAAP